MTTPISAEKGTMKRQERVSLFPIAAFDENSVATPNITHLGDANRFNNLLIRKEAEWRLTKTAP